MYRILCIVLLGWALSAHGAGISDEFTEGVDYKRIIPEQPKVTDTGKIEVVELFWYGCPHCHRFQPYVERWLRTKSDKIEYVREPAILRDDWAVLARAFFTAQALGIVDKIHQPLFNEIHNHKHNLNTEQDLAAFFASFGVDKDEFSKIFNSFTVDSKVRRARELSRRYNLWGTPSVVVDGKYRTDPNLVQGDYKKMLAVVDFLVNKEASENK